MQLSSEPGNAAAEDGAPTKAGHASDKGGGGPAKHQPQKVDECRKPKNTELHMSMPSDPDRIGRPPAWNVNGRQGRPVNPHRKTGRDARSRELSCN